MRTSKFTFLLAASLFTAVAATAQTKGRVTTDDGQPVAFAGVVILHPADSTVVNACLSGEDGTFTLPAGVRPCLLRVNALGYQTAYFPLPAAEAGKPLSLCLRPLKAKALGEATVTAKRPVARIEGDALVTTIESTSLSEAGNANDVLRQVPGIIDKGNEDGSLEVVGKGTPVYYINGRQVRDLKELKQLRSTDIKQVEVVSTPGARYDASVNAVVRIRTVRRKGEGFGLNFSEELEVGEFVRSDTYLKLTYRRNAFDLFAGVGFNPSKWFWESFCEQRVTTDEGRWQLPLFQHLESTQHTIPFEMGFNYEIADGHTLGFKYSGSATPKLDASGHLNSDVLLDGRLTDRLATTIVQNHDLDVSHSLNAYYVGRIGKGELSIDADFYASGDENTSYQNEVSETEDDRAFPTHSRVRNRLFAAKAQYEWPWLGGKVAFGGQYTQTNRHDNYFVDEALPGVTPARSKQEERTAAAFLQYSAFIAKRYALTAGLRFEHADYEYFNNGRRSAAQSPTYDNFFPSLSLSTAYGKGKNMVQLMAAYTVKTVRPSYYQLSNNVTYGNRFLLQGGNPNLKPMIKHDLTLTAVWKWIQTVFNYDHYTDGHLWWGESLPEKPEVTKVTYINKSYDGIQAMVTLSPKLGFYRPSWTLMYRQSFLSILTGGKKQRFNNPMPMATLNNTFVLPKDYHLGLNYTFVGRGEQQNSSVIDPMHFLEVYVSHSFLHKSLTVRMGGRDLLYKQIKNRIYMASGTFTQQGNGDSRCFYINLNYNLNAQRDRSKSKSEMDQLINRL